MTTIIDADGHVTEPRALWEEFADPAYRDRIIQVKTAANGEDRCGGTAPHTAAVRCPRACRAA